MSKFGSMSPIYVYTRQAIIHVSRSCWLTFHLALHCPGRVSWTTRKLINCINNWAAFSIRGQSNLSSMIMILSYNLIFLLVLFDIVFVFLEIFFQALPPLDICLAYTFLLSPSSLSLSLSLLV